MKTKFHEFNLSSTYKGDKAWKGMPKNTNNHIITVTNTETNKRTRFEFWESLSETEITTERQLINAFECFLSDALATTNCRDVWDFFSEFGYEPTRENYEIYKACQRALKKAQRVIGDEERLCDLINEISEAA